LKHSTTYGTDQGQGGIYYNLFDSHAPFQIDGNFGVCSGMAEMLLQSAHGYVNILPALPAVWEKNGEVTGMKAMGNFTVDFNWNNGKCQNVKIVSNAGAELKVRCTRGAMEIAKAKITVNGTEVGITVDAYGVATIPCTKNDIVDIDFTQETSIAPVIVDNAGNNAIYDLSGRRVTETVAHGIYIQNGVKVVAE
jgi:alpha-L-fucosidase 2